MGTSTVRRTPAETLLTTIITGLISGLIGGIAMGALLHVGSNLMPFIGALYGEPTVIGGWISHLLNSAVFGVLFAVIITRPTINYRIKGVSDYFIAGMLYATLIGLVTAGILLPVMMNAIGAQQLPDPAIATTSFVGETLVVVSVGVAHLVYGFVLGGAFYLSYPDQ